jgi:hypothetical protein
MYEGDLVSERVKCHLKMVHRTDTHGRCVTLLLLPSDFSDHCEHTRLDDGPQFFTSQPVLLGDFQ